MAHTHPNATYPISIVRPAKVGDQFMIVAHVAKSKVQYANTLQEAEKIRDEMWFTPRSETPKQRHDRLKARRGVVSE